MTNPSNCRPVSVEVCVESLEGALVAERAGASRLELNTALELDGLTPSPGLLKSVIESVKIPVIAMIRPRGGDYRYTDGEWRTMLADAEWMLEHGAAGVAFGALLVRGQVDIGRCQQMRSVVGSRQLIFHRAFDEAVHWQIALQQLIDVGVDRVMTSGGKPAAIDGVNAISQMMESARGRIEILPAGRIDASVALDLVQRTGCNQVHGSFSGGHSVTLAHIEIEIRKVIKELARLEPAGPSQ